MSSSTTHTGGLIGLTEIEPGSAIDQSSTANYTCHHLWWLRVEKQRYLTGIIDLSHYNMLRFRGLECLVGEELIRNRSVANRLLLIEAAIVSLCGGLFFVFVSLEFAYSVILGGTAFIVPNLLFVRFSLWKSAADSGSKALIWFYIAEVIKIASTIIIVTVSILLLEPLNMGVMFIAYALVLLINLAGLAIVIK